jgi:hypothetical protein
VTIAGVKARLARLLRRSGAAEEADQLMACLQALGNPPYWALGPGAEDQGRLLEAARRQTFRVGDRMTRLSAPVEWRQGEEHGYGWRLHLHSFSWLDPVLRNPGKDTGLLELALALAMDWVKAHRPGENGDADLVWSPMATAVRAPILAHLLRSAAYWGLLDGRGAMALRDAVIAHGRVLANASNYASGSDSGLYQDAGLVLITDYLPFLPQSPKWRRHAKRRFISHLRDRIEWREAIALGRSPRSQFRIQALVAALMHQMEIKDESAKDLLARMAETASWFVMPDGRLPPLGDSDSSWEPPRWAVDEAELRAGSMAAPRSGYAIVKEGASYLIVSAAYHSETQRADQLTFCLFGDGIRVLEDAGPSEGSILTVDGRDPGAEDADHPRPAITAAGQGDQWHAVLGENPRLLSQGVRHRRLFLFLAGLGLVVVDRVDADRPHRYTRRFRIGSEISIDGDRLAGQRFFQGTIADHSETPQRRSVLDGRRETLPGSHQGGGQRAQGLELTSEGSSDIFIAVICLQAEALTSPSVEWRDDDSVRVQITAGGHAEEIMLAVAEGELLVAEELVEHGDDQRVSMTGERMG